LAYLRLWMAKYYFLRGDYRKSSQFCDRACSKLQSLEQLCASSETRLIVQFSVSFNFACLHALQARLAAVLEQEDKKRCKILLKMAQTRLHECLQKDANQFLTFELLDLWFMDDFRHKNWFRKLYKKAHKRKWIPEQS